MKNKNILIIIFILIVLLLGVFYLQKDKAQENEYIEQEEIKEENLEAARAIFLEIEQSFYNIVEKIFALGDEATDLLEEEIIEIQKNLDNVKTELDEGVTDKEKIYESLVLIKMKIEDLTEKLIELDS